MKDLKLTDYNYFICLPFCFFMKQLSACLYETMDIVGVKWQGAKNPCSMRLIVEITQKRKLA